MSPHIPNKQVIYVKNMYDASDRELPTQSHWENNEGVFNGEHKSHLNSTIQ